MSDIKPVNYEYAGKVYFFDQRNPELCQKYPNGVKFDEQGFPDFSPYAIHEVKINMKGDYYHDFKVANSAVKLDRTPRGYTWHHHQDCTTMQLLPADLHNAVPHTGGVSMLKQKRS